MGEEDENVQNSMYKILKKKTQLIETFKEKSIRLESEIPTLLSSFITSAT